MGKSGVKGEKKAGGGGKGGGHIKHTDAQDGARPRNTVFSFGDESKSPLPPLDRKPVKAGERYQDHDQRSIHTLAAQIAAARYPQQIPQHYPTPQYQILTQQRFPQQRRGYHGEAPFGQDDDDGGYPQDFVWEGPPMADVWGGANRPLMGGWM